MLLRFFSSRVIPIVLAAPLLATAAVLASYGHAPDAVRVDSAGDGPALAEPSTLVDAATIPPVASFAEPGISPDGREIAFVSGGDIWTVPTAGGEARLLVSHPATESRPLYSPDGRSLAFVSTRTGNGDIYVLTLDSGDVRRVTYDDAREALSGWAPDSQWLYYSSNSQDISGMEDIFRVAADGGTPMPVVSERYFNEFNGVVAPDGARLAYTARGIASTQWWRRGHSHIDESEIWIAPLIAAAPPASPTSPPSAASAASAAGASGAAPTRVVPMGAKALWPMWAPDGRALFYVSDRTGGENIWRASLAESASPSGPARTSANVTKTNGHATAAPGDPDAGRAVTSFKDGRVLWPSISRDGKTIAFERNLAIWTLDTASGDAKAVPMTRRGAPAGLGSEHLTQTNRFRDLVLSPDGKKLAFAARGNLFAVAAKDGGSAFRVTASPAIDQSPAWTPDSRRLVFVAERDGASTLHLYDFATNTDTALTNGPRDYAPAIAPNGASVAFLRDGQHVCVASIVSTPRDAGATRPSAAASAASADPSVPAATSATVALAAATPPRCVAKAAVSAPLDAGGSLAWSPDSRWIAFMADGTKGFSNVSVVPVAGGDARPVSFVGNSSAGSLVWSPDGTFLMFTTGQRTEPSQIARVHLVLRTPKFREDQFRELFTPQAPEKPAPAPGPTPAPTTTTPAPAPAPGPENEDKSDAKPDQKPEKPDQTTEQKAGQKAEPANDKKDAKKPTEIVFEDIRRRLGVLAVELDADAITISPDGKLLLITASAAGQQNLYAYSIDELATERPVPRQITSTAGAKTNAQFSPDGKEVFYLEGGRIQAAPVERGPARTIAASAEIDVDFALERRELFTQAWSMLNENFYDSTFHGRDWAQARVTFAPYAAGAATPDELRRVLSLMIGELNASHLGVAPPQGAAVTTTGRLGLRFDAAAYAASGRLTIAEVLPLSPAAVTRAIAPGDVLIAVNGTALSRTMGLERLLEHTIDKRVVLTIESAQKRHDVAVQPVSLATEKALRYRAWVESNRAYVAKASQGRLGYVHMPDMGAPSLTQLYADLDAENHARDGVVIDIRNNNGGFVNAYALDVFARRPYLHMTLRGRDQTPARATLGQRALEAPTVLVVNQHSLSDAEDFTEGYRSLKLGKVVGEPTAGWIIYTWSGTLLDGSSLRLPRTRITDGSGQDMELHPRPVDVPISREPGDERAGRDRQLDAAVKELLAQLGSKP